MELQLVRHATLRLNYAGHRILIDPYFAAKHSREPLVGISRNPMVDLPMTFDEILADIELVIISHLHFDHFDPVAQETLPKDCKIICQPNDETAIMEHGFTDVTPLTDSLIWEGIKISRIGGQHGSGAWLERMGSVMGFVLQAHREPRLYWAGDTIWVEDVENALQTYQPEIIITHSSGSEFEDNSPIVMDAAQTIQVCKLAPQSKIVAVHMETIDHGTVSRKDLRAVADEANIPLTQLLIPQDGDTLSL